MREHVHDQCSPIGPKHPRHLTQSQNRLLKVVQDQSENGKVDARVVERERLGSTLPKLDIGGVTKS